MNAQKIMEAAFNEQGSPRTFTYMLQYYGTALGYLVDMINGTFETTNAPYFFWDFKVDGNDSTKGIDHTHISDGQTITFTYQQFDADLHTGTVIGKKHAFHAAK